MRLQLQRAQLARLRLWPQFVLDPLRGNRGDRGRRRQAGGASPPRPRGALCVPRSPCRGHADPGNADTVGRVETDGPDFVETKVADGRLVRLERAVSTASVHVLHGCPTCADDGCQHRYCGSDGCRSNELPQFEDADSVEGVGTTASLRDDPVSPDIPTLPLQATRDRHRSPVDAP